jgi:hypothetical protein
MNYYLIAIALVVVILIIRWIYLFLSYKSKIEKFESNITILEDCRDMTPKKLLAIFKNDSEKLGNVFAENKIPADLIMNKGSYPVIASFLVSKGIIKCEK